MYDLERSVHELQQQMNMVIFNYILKFYVNLNGWALQIQLKGTAGESAIMKGKVVAANKKFEQIYLCKPKIL